MLGVLAVSDSEDGVGCEHVEAVEEHFGAFGARVRCLAPRAPSEEQHRSSERTRCNHTFELEGSDEVGPEDGQKYEGAAARLRKDDDERDEYDAEDDLRDTEDGALALGASNEHRQRDAARERDLVWILEDASIANAT